MASLAKAYGIRIPIVIRRGRRLSSRYGIFATMVVSVSSRRRSALAAAVAVALALGALSTAAPGSGGSPAAISSHPCGGHERWDVKVLIDAGAEDVNYTPTRISVDRLRDMPRPASVGRGAPRVPVSESPVEFQTYRVTRVFLVEAKREPDKDIHLVIRDRHRSHTMIVEFPDPACPDASRSLKVAEMRSARDAFVAACGRPSASRFTELRGRATIVGVGFFDLVHGTPQRGRAPNNIELHPVLGFSSSDCQRV